MNEKKKVLGAGIEITLYTETGPITLINTVLNFGQGNVKLDELSASFKFMDGKNTIEDQTIAPHKLKPEKSLRVKIMHGSRNRDPRWTEKNIYKVFNVCYSGPAGYVIDMAPQGENRKEEFVGCEEVAETDEPVTKYKG